MQSALEIHWAGLQKPLSQKGVSGSVLQSVLEVQVLILEAEAMEIRPRIIVLNIFGKDLERVPNCGRKRLAVFHDPTTSTLKMQLQLVTSNSLSYLTKSTSTTSQASIHP